MKLIALPAAVLFVASVMSAQTPAPATPAAPAKPAADITITDGKIATPDTKASSADATKAAAKKDDKKKKEEPPPKIPGVEIARANGTYLGLEVAGGNWKLSFYDKKKKPVAPDITRANARWPNLKNARGDNRTVLNPSGLALVGSKPVMPPYAFNVFINLMDGDGEDAKVVENYVVPFHG